MSVFNHMIKVEQFNGSQDTFTTLAGLAKEDNHDIFIPTDVIFKDGQPVGCFMVQMLPVLSGYFSTKKMFPRDSVASVNIMEQIVKRTTGSNKLIFPINLNSPFHPVMLSLDYQEEKNHTYFFKKFL